MDAYQGYVTTAARAPLDERLAFLRKTYLLFTASLAIAGVGAFVGLQENVLNITAGSPMLCWMVEMGLIFACSALRRRPGINLMMLFGFTFVSGVVMTPMLLFAALRAGTPAVVPEAFALTCLTFGGLTAYVFITRQDFNWLRGFVVTALFAMIGLGLLNYFFFKSDAVSMAMSACGVLVFSCWILFDTSRILLRTAVDDSVGAALSLYLDFINLFLSILNLMSGRRRR
jgi:modulator of FtsH protease